MFLLYRARRAHAETAVAKPGELGNAGVASQAGEKASAPPQGTPGELLKALRALPLGGIASVAYLMNRLRKLYYDD